MLLLAGDWIRYRIVRNAHGGGIVLAIRKGLRDMMFVVHVVFLGFDADRSYPQAHMKIFDLSKAGTLPREYIGRSIAQIPNSIGFAFGLVEGLGFLRYTGPRCTD